MKLAIVAGGWHFPDHFYSQIPIVAPYARLYVIAHRSPELPIVKNEKQATILSHLDGKLGKLDREMYVKIPTIKRIRNLGWAYTELPNTVGDWGFFNQWLSLNNYRKFDAILNLHDDTYIRGGMPSLDGNWLLMGHGKYPQAPAGYVRGSLEFWKPELLDMLGGRIDLGELKLSRVGKTDSPTNMEDLMPWNDTAVPLRNFMRSKGLLDRIQYLSNFYRISPWFIEGERGLLSNNVGAPWSFNEGLKRWPV
jgi:hypothetical protein